MAQKVQLRKQQCKDVPSVFIGTKKKQYRKQQQCKGVPPVFHWYKKRNLGNNNKSRASRSFFIGTKKSAIITGETPLHLFESSFLATTYFEMVLRHLFISISEEIKIFRNDSN